MQSLLDWLLTLGNGTLYAVLGLTAAIENLVPPFPSDVVVAFGSFVAAQGDATEFAVFVAVWLGNLVGAFVVYVLGRRFGAERLERRLAGARAASRDARMRALFNRYGMAAVFVSRFVPGVRAVVPAFAGALRLNVVWTMAMIASASAIWYGVITWIAFRVGADWGDLRAALTQYSRTAAIIGTSLFVIGVVAWLVIHRRQNTN
jgi:membrane protein DedA with SNARE-associated domain